MVGPLNAPNATARSLNGDAAPLDWNKALRAELDHAVVQGNGRWSRALLAVAWIHLFTFLSCQLLHDPLVERDVADPPLNGHPQGFDYCPRWAD